MFWKGTEEYKGSKYFYGGFVCFFSENPINSNDKNLSMIETYPGFQIRHYFVLYSPQSFLIALKLNFLLTIRKHFLERSKILCLSIFSLRYIDSNYIPSNCKGRGGFSYVKTEFRVFICNIVHVYMQSDCNGAWWLTPWPFGNECSVNLTELRALHFSLQLTVIS